MKNILVLMVFAWSATGNALAEGNSIEKIIDVMTRDHVYAALPLISKEIDRAGPDVLNFVGLSIKTELLLSRTDKRYADYLLLCSNLKKINEKGGIQLPAMLTSKDSRGVQADVCGIVDGLSGEQAFDLGMKVLMRTKSGIFDSYTIRHAIPYFLLSERRGFKDEELYSIMSVIHGEMKDYSSAYAYARKFFTTDNRKGMNAGQVQRILSISKWMLANSQSRSDIDELRKGLEKAQNMGDKKSASLLLSLNEIVTTDSASSGSGIQQVSQCSKVVRNDALYAYCTRGDCSGFVRNDGIWHLCSRNDKSFLARNHNVWSYLNNGDAAGFSKEDFKVWNQAKKSADSFESRKRFVIFYLHGYLYSLGDW